MSKMIKIGVVIPAYKVKKQILKVVTSIPNYIEKIYIIDDACPECTGNYLLTQLSELGRIQIIFHNQNKGVGGAVITGYEAAIIDGCSIVVKMDGDGQMDPDMLPYLLAPILNKKADYSKGNRFYEIEGLKGMPLIRVIGNSGLSFINKIASGYWNIFDPTNGYTAIHIEALQKLNLSRISNRYFFESDMLFRLNIIKAVVADVYIPARYDDEKSNLLIKNIFFEFIFKNLKNLIKRIFYNYYLRDMSIGSFELPVGLLLLNFGLLYGGYHWYLSIAGNAQATAGTVVLSAMCIIMGVQFILAFLNNDIATVPSKPLQDRIKKVSIDLNNEKKS